MKRSIEDNQKKFSHKIFEFLGLRSSIIAMLFMVILVGMGENMAERYLPIYLIALGGGALSVGFLNGMDNLLSALYSFPGGYLSDKLGYKKALLVFNLIAMAGYLIVIFIHMVGGLHWSCFVPVMVSNIPPGNDESCGRSFTGKQTHNGCFDALIGKTNSYGSWSNYWGGINCLEG